MWLPFGAHLDSTLDHLLPHVELLADEQGLVGDDPEGKGESPQRPAPPAQEHVRRHARDGEK